MTNAFAQRLAPRRFANCRCALGPNGSGSAVGRDGDPVVLAEHSSQAILEHATRFAKSCKIGNPTKGLMQAIFWILIRFMADAVGKRSRTKRQAIDRTQILQQVKTPLGFYVLTLLILEGTLSIVLTCSKLTEEHIWSGFLWMVGMFIGVVVLVTLFVWKKPERLLFEQEQYLPPELDPSALRDQIEDLIYKNVKPESLQKH